MYPRRSLRRRTATGAGVTAMQRPNNNVGCPASLGALKVSAPPAVKLAVRRRLAPGQWRAANQLAFCISAASRCARPLHTPPGSRSQPTGHVARPSRSILVSPAPLLRLAHCTRRPLRCAVPPLGHFRFHQDDDLLSQLRNIFVFVFLDENSKHVHERSERMIFIFTNLVSDTIEQLHKFLVIRVAVRNPAPRARA